MNESWGQERQQFKRFMRINVARLSGFAGRYTRRLPNRECKLFLGRALRIAWRRRGAFVPGKENAGLLIWWGSCLKHAALSRPHWHQVYQDDVRVIRSKDLGR